MKTSESVKNIAPALVRAQGKFAPILRSKTARIKGDKGEYSFNYAPLEEILATLRPTLQEEKLAIMQGVDGFCLVTTLLHESGEWISHSMELPHSYPSPRAFGSELTFRRRYSVTAVLGIASEEDDDGQEAERQLKGKKTDASPQYSAAQEKQKTFDAMPPDEQDFLKKIAANVIAMLDEDREDEAYGYLRNQNLDTDEQLAIQALFDKKQSKRLAEAGKRYWTMENAAKRQERKAA